MIPQKLSLSGFLSYRDPVEIDFSTFDLACISGQNGAGKSSLLDAITWSLFGQARKRDESLIHSHPDVKAAEVVFQFEYESCTYRVQRTLPRGKTSLLEFHLLQHGTDGQRQTWKPLTERTLRETQAKIEKILRMDYETFTNASFFLQGKADQFTQQRPGDRKHILGSILGLEIWEQYQKKTAELRKELEAQLQRMDGRLNEISAELSEEETRKYRLKELEAQLEESAKRREAQEATQDTIRKAVATLAEQRRLVEALARQAEAAAQRVKELEGRLALRQEEKDTFTQLISRQDEIQAAYAAWQQKRAALETWDATAQRFREQEKRRQAPLDEINTTRARLQQEQTGLQERLLETEAQRESLPDLRDQLAAAHEELNLVEKRIEERALLEEELRDLQQRLVEARADNQHLKDAMDELKQRIDQLAEVEEARCPLCGQPLSSLDRQSLMDSLSDQGKEMGDRYRQNRGLLEQADILLKQKKEQIQALSSAERELREQTRRVEQLTNRVQQVEKVLVEWEMKQQPRLEELNTLLAQETFCPEARLRLAEIDLELKEIGYDAAAHDAIRQAEMQGRASENKLRELEKALAALAGLEREITEMAEQGALLRQEAVRQNDEYQAAEAGWQAAQAQAPDLYAAEQELFRLQELENSLRLEVGAARQKVLVLGDLKARQKSLEADRDEITGRIGQYKQLERAFSKDGIPAVLIEQALPQIEEKANNILDRLSGGGMSVRFLTQAAYKDKNREDLRETLDILISDGSGTRDYELFSGGEAFRVNFAIRLALSEVLAQRAGARLRMLVIDEGFGSQDAQGRQRLVEAINLVKGDFAKILVITHIDELKDQFPARIEVEKTARGSQVQLI
jgi:DNA repair protein SbcC/Rad50